MAMDIANIETGRTRLTVKSQVTIKQNIREAWGVEPGDEVKFILIDDELKVKKVDD
jgi:bifunctional DNA-binding transcriptional regulator/antitoxin component of YhaV-PrlF toxin-antitoxin module